MTSKESSGVNARRVRRIVALVAVVASIVIFAAAGGCNSHPDISPSGGLGDPVPAPMNDPTITVLSPELRQWLFFHPAIISRTANGLMVVEVPVRNAASRMYLTEYRIIFYDENGSQLGPLMSWEFQEFHPKQLVHLKRTSLTAAARSYRLELKWSE